ncbi:MAG: hypothetical protein NTZ59_10410 [Bacteroidetes bacterium]|nr:hypothetical protein [Bacteroidota bacterium]
MSKNESVRDYKFGDDELWQKADALVGSIQRDIADFAPRKVDAVRIGEIATIVTQFKNHPTDQELLGVVSTATETKDATALELRKKLSAVRNMAVTKYGQNGKYKTFDFGALSELPDTDLYRTAKRVVRVGTSFLVELASEGLTAAMLTEITTLATTLDTNLDTMEAAIENRDIKTQERVAIGNNLWNTMVKYANVGKSIYEFTDEARYNDYVLIDDSTPPNTPPTP